MKGDRQHRQFVDANIFLYAYDYSDPLKHGKAKSLVKKLWNSDAMIISSAVKTKSFILWTEDLNHGQEYSGVKV